MIGAYPHRRTPIDIPPVERLNPLSSLHTLCIVVFVSINPEQIAFFARIVRILPGCDECADYPLCSILEPRPNKTTS